MSWYDTNKHHRTSLEEDNVVSDDTTLSEYEADSTPLPAGTFDYVDQTERASNTAAAAIINLSGDKGEGIVATPSWGMTI